MKQKVIVYNADGNSIRYRMTELEQVREHVFLGKRRSDTCGNQNVELVLCIKGVYFLEAVRAESSVRNESLLDNLEELSHNFMETVLEDEKFYPGYIILELFRHTGTREQLEISLEQREKIIRLRKEEEEIRRRNYEQKRRQEKERLEQKHEEDYRKTVETFKSGEHIHPEWIMEMAARCGIKLHPKTIHNIHRHCTLASVKSLSVNNKKRDYSGVFTAIRKIAEKLNVQTDGRNENKEYYIEPAVLTLIAGDNRSGKNSLLMQGFNRLSHEINEGRLSGNVVWIVPEWLHEEETPKAAEKEILPGRQ